MGIPLPGETTLVTAALYAGATGRLSIAAVVFAAAAGAIVGDNIGFWIGRTLGYRWVVRHQSALRLTPKRLRLGQYLFDRHGGKVVFLGRFVAVLRAFAALLAGLNRMRWRRFLVFNMMGAIVWASAYGGGAYAFGDKLTSVLGETGILLSAAAAALVVIGFLLARKYERRVSDEAERHVPLTRET
jgi:membrane protein DedA with SNARE-associated domain